MVHERTRFGDFEVVREIGRGGMGVVYEATQLSLNRRVALKVLPWGITTTSKQVDRFRREAKAAGKLHHTNIVPIYAQGEHQGTYYYAMEYIEGRSGLRCSHSQGVRQHADGGYGCRPAPRGS